MDIINIELQTKQFKSSSDIFGDLFIEEDFILILGFGNIIDFFGVQYITFLHTPIKCYYGYVMYEACVLLHPCLSLTEFSKNLLLTRIC